MKVVYSLRQDAAHVADVQAASLSPKPFGIKSTHGLFGSDDWWQNLESGVVPIVTLAGTITKLTRSGMHNDTEGFEMQTMDGETFAYDCVAQKKRDRGLYRVGCAIEFSYVLQPLKNPTLALPGRDGCVLCPIEIRIEEDA